MCLVCLVPDVNAKQNAVPFDLTSKIKGEALVTRVIMLDNTNANELVPVIRPLLPQFAHLAAINGANALIISDHANNIIEIEIRYPIIAVSEEINIDFNYWISVLNRQYGEWPIIYFDKKNIVNPMCKYWFKSAIVQLNGLKSQYPEHFAKYNYLLNIFDDMNLQKPIFPKDSLDDLVKNGVLKRINLK